MHCEGGAVREQRMETLNTAMGPRVLANVHRDQSD